RSNRRERCRAGSTRCQYLRSSPLCPYWVTSWPNAVLRPGSASASKSGQNLLISAIGGSIRAQAAAWGVEIVRVRLSRRLDAERLGDGGDLGALALDRGDELLCAAATRRLCGRIELVVDRLVVGHRDHIGADALTQFRRQGPACEQADIAVHFQFRETRFDAGRNIGQARCPLAPHLRKHRDPAGLSLRAQDGV